MTGPPAAGPGIVRAAEAGTVVFTLTAVGGVLVPGLRGVATLVALSLFLAGSVIFLVALVLAAGRSRTHAIGIGGLFFLAGGTVPAGPRRRLRTALAVETVVALATASARPFTSAAFAILVPIFGLALAGLWGARHGAFGLRSGEGAAG